MPDPLPRPEKAPTSNGRGTERVLRRPINRLSPPEEKNNSTRDFDRGPAAGPQVHPPNTYCRPAPDSAEEDDDQGLDITGPCWVAWAQPGDLRQVDKCEDTCTPRCPCGRLQTLADTCGPRGGTPPMTQGKDISPQGSRKTPNGRKS